MIPKILEIENDSVIININCLSLKPLKDIIDKFPKKKALDMFKVLYYYYPSEDNPIKAFSNIEEEIRLEEIMKHFGIDETMKQDTYFVAAFDFLQEHYISTIWKLYLNSKKNLELLSNYATTPIFGGLGGNAAERRGLSKDLPAMIKNHMDLEKTLKDATFASRGNKKVASDINQRYDA